MKKATVKKPAPTLVLMAGLPGVGKSTLAAALGKRLGLGWVVLDKDTIQDSILEDALLKQSIAENMVGRAAYEAFFKLAHDFLVQQNMSVILDNSTLQSFIFEQAVALAHRSGARFKVILCQVDEPTRRHRLHNRKIRISQSQAHLVSPEKAKQFDTLPLPSHTLTICTKKPLDKYLHEAETYVLAQDQSEHPSGELAASDSHQQGASILDHVKQLAGLR